MAYNKQQYIERFGEEYYYNIVLPRMRLASKKYSETENGKKVRHSYNISEKGKEAFSKYAHSEKGKERIKEKQQKYLARKEGKAMQLKNRYIALDRKKGFNTNDNVDETWILNNILNSKCYYCGETDWTKLGCDRMDNKKAHTQDNCICSCWDCNLKRSNKYSIEEFKKKIEEQKKKETS